MRYKITIGTRSSKLALWQANHVKEELSRFYPDVEINLKEIKTKGDHITDVSLSKVEGKGFFTKEIEDELLGGEIDLAVHSLKDLPTRLPDGLKIGAVLKREEAHDVLIVNHVIARRLEEPTKQSYNVRRLLRRTFGAPRNDTNAFRLLPKGVTVGTSSLRRVAQLKAIRNDLEYVDLRGNLDTRIRKLDEGKYNAIVLAYAGVKRLGFEDRIAEHFNPKEILPAVGQGALAIEIRESDNEMENIISKLNDEESFLMSLVERSFLETLQGGCQVPIGVYSEIKDGKITLYGMISSLNGEKIIKDKKIGNVNKAKNIGVELAEVLLRNGGEKILREINVEMLRRSVSIGV